MSAHFGRARRVRPANLRRHAAAVLLRGLLVAIAPMVAVRDAHALSDEIDVYTGELTPPGEFDLTVHANEVTDGRAVADDAGGLVPDQALTGGTEWAYGVAPWLELGLYAPIITIARDASVADRRVHLDGAEIRAFIVAPRAEAAFTYGLNIALELNARRWEAHPRTLELRPVLSWCSGRWRLSVNPTLEWAFTSIAALQVSPAERIDYRISARWQVGIEEYGDDMGPISHLLPLQLQNQRLFAVTDVVLGAWSAETGVGLGLTPGSDRLTVKLMLTRPLN